jgi:hypothetical protein
MITVLGIPLDGWASLSVLIQFVLPLLVGAVTSKMTGRKEQSLLLGVLTLIATVATQALSAHALGVPLNLLQVLIVAIVNFIVSTGAHYGLWKPTGLTELLLSMFVTVKPSDAPAVPTFPVPDPDAPISPASPVPALSLVPPMDGPAARAG